VSYDVTIAIPGIGEDGVECRHAFKEAGPVHPQPLQRRNQAQRRLEVRLLETPRERRPDIVDLAFGPLHDLVVAFECRRGLDVVVAMAVTYLIGFA
jgi:hypothetical protein